MQNRTRFSVLALSIALASCGAGDSVDLRIGIGVGSPWFDWNPNPIPSDVLIAKATVAPGDGATISGIVRLQVVGWNMRNVELLPPTGYEPVYARFVVNPDGRFAYADFDTRTLPNGALNVRISVFNRFMANPSEREFVALQAQTWFVLN